MPLRADRTNAMPVPAPCLLRAMQRLARVVGTQAALHTINEAHFVAGDAQQVSLAAFVAKEGPHAQWREMIVHLHPAFSSWGPFSQEEALLFVLCVTHVYLSSGQSWYPNEPNELTRRLCTAAGIQCSNVAAPGARVIALTPPTNVVVEDAEVLHQGPDQ